MRAVDNAKPGLWSHRQIGADNSYNRVKFPDRQEPPHLPKPPFAPDSATMGRASIVKSTRGPFRQLMPGAFKFLVVGRSPDRSRLFLAATIHAIPPELPFGERDLGNAISIPGLASGAITSRSFETQNGPDGAGPFGTQNRDPAPSTSIRADASRRSCPQADRSGNPPITRQRDRAKQTFLSTSGIASQRI